MRRKLSILFLVAVFAYIASYAVLSFGGAYAPFGGCLHETYWDWAPRGFADKSGHFRKAPMIAFLPLWLLDSHYWHKEWIGPVDSRPNPAWPNKPAAGNAGIAPQLTSGHSRPGVPEPER